MSSSAHRLSVTVLVCVLGCLGQLFADDDVINLSGSDELKSDTHKSVVNHMRKILEQQTIVRQGPNLVVEKLNPAPVLNWDDVVRNHHHGTLWVWGQEGRPAAIIEMYTNRFSDTVQGWPGNVVHSLAPEALRAEGKPQWEWAPDEPGFRPEKLPEPVEVAKSTRLRRTQMRALARRFASNQTWKEGRSELRLLPTPILLYESAKEGILDGGLFVFVHGGTNPEVILILEAIDRGNEKYWQFGCVRLGHAKAEVTFDEHEVWSVDTYTGTSPKVPYYWLPPR